MTEALAGAVPVPVRRPVAERMGGILAAIVVYLAAVAALLSAGVDGGTIGRCSAYWLLAVLLPGWLVMRAAVGAQLTWLAEVSVAACTGLALELIGWAAFSAAGQQRLLGLWPVLSLLVLTRSAWRSRLRDRPASRLPLGWVVALTVGALVVVRFIYGTYLNYYGMPYAGRKLYIDMPWQMGLAAEARRSLPLLTPQATVAGDLHYHWFAHAHMASESLISGTPVQVVLAQTYILPLALLVIGMSVTLAHVLSGRAWAGAVAGFVAAAPMTVTWWPQLYKDMSAYIPLSPTQMYALPLTLFVLFTITILVRRAVPHDVTDGRDQYAGVNQSGAWVLFALSIVVVTGAKASATPTLLGGSLLALLATLILRRGRRVMAIVTAVVLVATAAATKYVSGGSGGGSGYQLLQIGARSPLYEVIVGYEHYTADHWIAPHITVPTVLVGVLLFEVIRLAGLLGTLVAFGSRLRGRPEAWLLSGCAGAAILALIVIQHQGLSQLYFIRGILPIGGVAVAWALAEALGDSVSGRWASRRMWWCLTVALVVAGIAAAGEVVNRHNPRPATPRAAGTQVREAVLIVGGAVVLVVVVALVARWIGRRHQAPGMWVATVLSALLGLIGANVVTQAVAPTASGHAPSTTLSRAEARAGQWISENTDEFALFATNDHCAGPETLVCNSDQWWISGLGGRRVLVEGWSYVPQSANRNPFFDQQLLHRNQAAFSPATPADLAWMKAQGVQYLVAVEEGGGPVSARLFDETTTVFQDGPIRIVRLR